MRDLIQQHYTKHFDTLVKRAARALGDWHYGEDCVQEAYENALKYSHTFDGSNFDRWFNTVFMNTIKKFFRFIQSQGVTQELKTPDHPLYPTNLTEKHKDLIKTEIQQYKTKQHIKDVLVMYFISGWRGKELEVLTGMTVPAIYSNIERFKTKVLIKYEADLHS